MYRWQKQQHFNNKNLETKAKKKTKTKNSNQINDRFRYNR